MANAEDDWLGWAGNVAEVAREREDWPSIGDTSELGVLGIRKLAILDELGADDAIFARLVRRSRPLRRMEIKVQSHKHEFSGRTF